MSTNQIISKVCSFCNTLRDDGVGYGDYLEQLTYLLVLKMADEYSKPSLADMDNLPDPDVLAEEIVENLESALDGFRNIIAQLKK